MQLALESFASLWADVSQAPLQQCSGWLLHSTITRQHTPSQLLGRSQLLWKVWKCPELRHAACAVGTCIVLHSFAASALLAAGLTTTALQDICHSPGGRWEYWLGHSVAKLGNVLDCMWLCSFRVVSRIDLPGTCSSSLRGRGVGHKVELG
jgi:hypothetical protein